MVHHAQFFAVFVHFFSFFACVSCKKVCPPWTACRCPRSLSLCVGLGFASRLALDFVSLLPSFLSLSRLENICRDEQSLDKLPKKALAKPSFCQQRRVASLWLGVGCKWRSPKCILFHSLWTDPFPGLAEGLKVGTTDRRETVDVDECWIQVDRLGEREWQIWGQRQKKSEQRLKFHSFFFFFTHTHRSTRKKGVTESDRDKTTSTVTRTTRSKCKNDGPDLVSQSQGHPDPAARPGSTRDPR